MYIYLTITNVAIYIYVIYCLVYILYKYDVIIINKRSMNLDIQLLTLLISWALQVDSEVKGPSPPITFSYKQK